MFKGLISIILFVVCLFILFLMLAGSYILKMFRQVRKTVQDTAEQQARQYQDETGRQRRQYTQKTKSTTQNSYRANEPHQSHETHQSTIIDNRHQQRENRKIFDEDDGEYVEYTEVSNEK